MGCHLQGRIASSSIPSNHIATNNDCESCHTTTSWMTSGFNHDGVAPGTCATCHNGSTATGKPSNHLVTSASCDDCHTTSAWTPASFTHSSPNYVDHGRTISCSSCHRSTPESAANAWSNATTHLIVLVVMLMIMNLVSTAMHPSAACAIAPEAAISRRLSIVRRSGRGSYARAHCEFR